jgi:hypothetical protein
VSSYSDFAEKMLVALYQETEATNRDYYSFGDLIDKYDLDWREQWIDRLADEWEGSYARNVNRFHADSRRDWSAEISAAGMRYVEEKYGDKDGVGQILTPISGAANFLAAEDGSPLVTEDGAHLLTADMPPIEAAVAISISSADWTGIEERLQTDRMIVRQIEAHIGEIDKLVEQTGLTNTERQKAKAITEALKLLIASPEPEWKAIATLLTSPSLTAVLNVATIVQLVLKLFGIG